MTPSKKSYSPVQWFRLVVMSREIAIVNYIIHHDYFHIGIKEQASDALGPGRHNGIRGLVINTSLMEPVELWPCDHQEANWHQQQLLATPEGVHMDWIMGLVTITLMESGAIIHHAYFHIGIEEQLSDALEPGHHYTNWNRSWALLLH